MAGRWSRFPGLRNAASSIGWRRPVPTLPCSCPLNWVHLASWSRCVCRAGRLIDRLFGAPATHDSRNCRGLEMDAAALRCPVVCWRSFPSPRFNPVFLTWKCDPCHSLKQWGMEQNQLTHCITFCIILAPKHPSKYYNSLIIKAWRRGRESNPRIPVLQTSALPLCYLAVGPGWGGRGGIRRGRGDVNGRRAAGGKLYSVFGVQYSEVFSRQRLYPNGRGESRAMGACW